MKPNARKAFRMGERAERERMLSQLGWWGFTHLMRARALRERGRPSIQDGVILEFCLQVMAEIIGSPLGVSSSELIRGVEAELDEEKALATARRVSLTDVRKPSLDLSLWAPPLTDTDTED